MAFRLFVTSAVILALAGGASVAQMEDPAPNSFYADPVLPDPPLKPAHVFPASVATQDVAAVAPAAGASLRPQHMMACTALNPCAVPAPARG